MPWVRLADDFADHPKLIAAGPLAGWLWVCALAYANKHLTDGYVPTGAVRRLIDADDPARLASRLIDVGLWDRADGGYRIHDFADYQPSAAAVKAEREQGAARQRELRERRKSGHDSGRSNGSTSSVTPGSPVPAVNPAVNPDPAGTTTPLPPPPAEGERRSTGRRRERIDSRQQDPDAAVAPSSPEVPLSPLAPTDAELWERCREQLRADMSPANWSQLVEPLEPLGRAADGGLHLRAPPGQQIASRMTSRVQRALLDQGEAAATLSTISER